MSAAAAEDYDAEYAAALKILDGLDTAGFVEPNDESPVDGLTQRLYALWYAAPGHDVVAWDNRFASLDGVLRTMHADRHRWSAGWTVLRVAPHGVVVARGPGGEVRVLTRGDYVHDGRSGRGTAGRCGETVKARVARTSADDAGWWRSWGTRWTSAHEAPDAPLIRMYVAARPVSRPDVVRAITRAVHGWDVPWALKIAADDVVAARPDAAVLYVLAEHVARLGDRVDGLAEDLTALTTGRTPPLTLTIANGVSLAESPPDGSSFGEHRCAVLVAAHRTVHATATARHVDLDVVHETLVSAGIDPAHPYRSATATWDLRWRH